MNLRFVVASTEEYKLLEKLNKLSTENFAELTNKTKDVSSSIQQIQDKAKELQPCLDEIDVLEASASELLNTAQLLDDYSKRVGEPVPVIVSSFVLRLLMKGLRRVQVPGVDDVKTLVISHLWIITKNIDHPNHSSRPSSCIGACIHKVTGHSRFAFPREHRIDRTTPPTSLTRPGAEEHWKGRKSQLP